MPELKTTLYEETAKLLRERPRTMTLENIAIDTGITLQWLYQFSRNRHKKPCVNHVQTIYEHLSGRNLI